MNTYGHVVDDEGKPLEVYHGTTKDFDKFVLGHPERKDVGWLGHGLYFTNSRDMAQANAQMKAKRVGGTPKVMSVNLSLQNPYYATLEDKARLQKANSSEASKAFTEALKSKGHDGVIWKSGDYHEYVAFDPDQVMIKKAEGGEVLPFGHPQREANLGKFMEGAHPAVLNKDGTPKLFYHATYASEPIKAFDRLWSTKVRKPSMDTVGTWFSDTPSEEGGAGMYAQGQGASIYPMHLSAKKLKTYHRFEDFLRDMHEAEGRKLEEQNPKGQGSTEGLREKLKAQGYDGLYFPKNESVDLFSQIENLKSTINQAKSAYSSEAKRRWDEGEDMSLKEMKAHQKRIDNLVKQRMDLEKKADSYGGTEFGGQNVVVVFEPTQIKSPWNQGTFDPNDPDTHKAEGGEVDSDLKTAKRLGMDTSSIPEIRKAGQLREAYKTLGEKIREGSMAAAQRAKEYHESGKLPLPVGTRFTTEHSRKNKLPPFKVLAHYVDHKDPERYGYRTEQGEEGRGDYTSGIQLVSDPKADTQLEKLGKPFDRKAYWDNVQVLGGITRVKAEGGAIRKGGPVSLDAMRLALLNRPKMAEGGDVDSPFPRGRAQRRMAVKSSVGPQPLTISKEPGGQWIGGKFGGVEQVVNRYKQMGDATPEKQAVNNWLDTTLTKYMKRDFGTEKDPVRILMEEGITHHENPEAIEAAGFFGDPWWLLQRRKQYGMPENLISKNVLAKKWESGADKMIGTSSAEDLIKKHPYAVEMLSENPWIKKVDPKTKIHFFDTGLGGEINFRHLTDELHNSLLENSNLPQSLKLRPESLSRMSVPQAVQHVHKINEWRKDNRAESNLEKSINSAVHLHKDYPDSNLAWYEIKHPAMTADEQAALRDADLESIEDAPESLQSKYKALEEALQYEGDTMGHCVGGYADDVASGNSRIFSLRNKRTGEPHVTIEATAPQMRGGQSAEQYRNTPFDIAQIKGKGNAKPVSKYIPFVQDFVKSGKWGDVGEIENADLIHVGNVLTPKERDDLRKQGHEVGDYVSKEDLIRFKSPPTGSVVRKAGGGLIKETVMPTLAQMKMALSGRPKDLQSIGAQEAPDMTPKSYLPPDRRGMLPPGGVATPSGMPIGGIDMSQMPGQQLMPTNALQPQGGLPQGADQGSPVAPNAPQSNILQMTPQGQQMAAMTPSAPQQLKQPQQMQDGGVVQYPTINDGVFKAEDDQPGLFRATGMANGGSTKFAIQPPKAAAKTPDNFTPYDDSSPSIKKLTTAFNEAIAHHLSLSPEERVANSQRAAAAVAEHIGRTNTGKPKDLLGKNAKLMKTEKGNEEAIKLPDGRGVETTGLALSPAYQEKQFQTCPNHAACKAECLGKTSGNYFKLGGGEDLEAFKGPRLNSLRKTQAFLRDPHSFAVKLYDEIQAAKDMAAANGNHLGVRLNVLSDISPDVHEAIIKGHPDVTFYDYTKNKSNPIASNHHYTYSSTGATQPGVENPNTNWKRMRQRLDNGDNVAMAFSHKEHLPHEVHDQETGKVYRVVDGDTHDFRPLDMQPEGEPGVIIGLKNKKATGKVHEAHKDSKGFFVHYDPQLKMNPNGTYERSPIPRLTKEGKPKLGETIPQNRRVNIIPQDKVAPAFDNDGEKQ